MKSATRQLVVDDAKQAQQPLDEKAKLEAELAQAIAQADWKLTTSIAKQLADYDAKLAALELADKQSKLAGVGLELTNDVRKLVESYIQAGKLDIADHVSFYWDMSKPLTDIHVSLLKAKTASTRSKSATGYGKKHPATEELLAKHGSLIDDKTGLTFNEAWKQASGKNPVYQVRVRLLKKIGLTS